TGMGPDTARDKKQWEQVCFRRRRTNRGRERSFRLRIRSALPAAADTVDFQLKAGQDGATDTAPR
ncbi:MAG TPA: hypothetical protein VE196_07055, partial [Pseudonocardiaceae bacterium]|nr:hypothetical protein [Pseudonocardiaceae bacterium]